MSCCDIFLPLLAYLVVFVNHGRAEDPVKLTLLAVSYIYNDNNNDMKYACYVSDQGIDIQVDVIMTSSRYVWTRETEDENPAPPAAEYHYHPDWPRYRVMWNNEQDNNVAFGVFNCAAEISGKEDTTVSHIRMRSDADIVPANGLLYQTVSINETGVSINMMSTTGRDVSMFRWNKDNSPLSATGLSDYTINRPVQLEDAGVYECYVEGERNLAKQAMNLLIVRACPATLWGPPDCTGVCNNCYNGGICDENTAQCVCPPGFNGTECKTTCGFNRFGDDCEFQCSSIDVPLKCRGILFCLRHPYGCICNTGFHGVSCNQECDAGTYGASCLQTCHCNTNQCNSYTGVCTSGCSSGWTGTNCQECDGNTYGSDCSQECHCDKESCNRESGLCQTGGCLEQWVDLFPPFCCQTGLINVTNTKQNPGITGWITCVATEGRAGDLDSLDLIVSRDQNRLDMNGIISGIEMRDGLIKIQTFLVNNVNEGDELYCQLRQNDELLAMLRVTVEVYILPSLNSPPELVAILRTSVTIRWSPWEEGITGGDGPVLGYTLYYMEESITAWSKADYITAAESLEYIFTDLKPDTSYSLGVAAVREGERGEGPRGPSQNATTLCKVPLSPFDVDIELFEEHILAIVSWEVPNIQCSSGITQFIIYYESISIHNKGHEYVTDISATSHELYALKSDQEYNLYMTLVTSGGESEHSEVISLSISRNNGFAAGFLVGAGVAAIFILGVLSLAGFLLKKKVCRMSNAKQEGLIEYFSYTTETSSIQNIPNSS